MEVEEGAAKAGKHQRGNEAQKGQSRDRNTDRHGADGGIVRVAEGQVATVDRHEQIAGSGVSDHRSCGCLLHADLGSVCLTMPCSCCLLIALLAVCVMSVCAVVFSGGGLCGVNEPFATFRMGHVL